MGVTIHYRLGQSKGFVPKMLDDAQRQAEDLRDNLAKKVGVPVEVERLHPYRLLINIGNCESLMLGFGSLKHWEEKVKKDGWSYEASTLATTFPRAALDNEDMMFCSAFCKTQYAEKLMEHKWVADLIRLVAGRCEYTYVYDEGGYYHTGVLEDAAEAIGANGAMIAELGQQLKDNFGADNVQEGGETKIKPIRAKKP